ncbi:hypothetical protein ACP4OV_010963 [Aristida adscensionis]
MATKRAYKLQEFAAHTSSVNCVKFGKRTSRMLITGGEDTKVNLWALGKPSALQSLSGLTSPVESVSFDSSEVTIGAGSAGGTIKIWDVEEAKVAQTFTGHRSNCASLDFHPFGEFLASGSSDTNMKIWDIRKKGCIHTYKGHTRRIDVLKFTPDGRWIVSGGADNSVKIWDLTAGKLLHDFSLHEGPINCLDFHPHEFLLATGSTDKTLKFWDLETFELIGSSGPEVFMQNSRDYFVPASIVRSVKFDSDGKTLFCGLHESLKVLSWEPIICHDVVDVGWSTLADLTVDGGKLLGCSYNQSCVGIWVVDLTRSVPCNIDSAESNLSGSVNRPMQTDNSISSVFGRLSVSRNPASEIASNNLLKRSISASKGIPVPASSTLTKRMSKEPGTSDLRFTRSDSLPILSPRVRLSTAFIDDQKRQLAAAVPLRAPRFCSKVNLYSNDGALPHNSHASSAPMYRSRSNISVYSGKESSFIPVIAPRRSSEADAGPIVSKAAIGDLPVLEPQNIEHGGLTVSHDKEDCHLVPVIDSRCLDTDIEGGSRRITGDTECKNVISETSSGVNLTFGFPRTLENQMMQDCIFQSKPTSTPRKFTRETLVAKYPQFASINRNAVPGLSQPIESSRKHSLERRPYSSNYDSIQYEPTLDDLKQHSSIAGKQSASVIDEDAMVDLMENHQEFIHAMKSRLTKLQVVYQFWQRNDMKGSIDATWRILDFAVTADIISVLMENSYITLDICSSVLHLVSSLLESPYDRHLSIALEMVLKLVKSFGTTIVSTLLAVPPVGVDLEAEQRLERCNLCFQELKKVSTSITSLTRRQGEVGRSAQELSVLLQDIFNCI